MTQHVQMTGMQLRTCKAEHGLMVERGGGVSQKEAEEEAGRDLAR